jgi:predicted 2-oxoglutarate/Fe(II)-dependent dioxygenase YbiX/peroxiredoxin
MTALAVGDFVPWFIPAAPVGPNQVSQPPGQDFVMGGYRAVLFFFGRAQDPQLKQVLNELYQARQQFARQNLHFFAIGIDPADRVLEQSLAASSHFHWLWDVGGEISVRYDLCRISPSGSITYDPTTFVLSENLQILDRLPLAPGATYAQQLLQRLAVLPQPAPARLIQQQAPVLLIPNVFSPQFCQQLIQGYETHGGVESGFMRQEGQNTKIVLDPKVKRRRDWLLTDPTLLQQINSRLGRRIVPEIEKAFQFRATRFERYTVACYEASQQGFFQPHRDNTAQGNAHRRFALTLNLNEGYEGGYLRFPEYGPDLYGPEPGGAVVFSCSLLHEVLPVTQGRRFVLLSFFYGEAEAQLRQQTQQQIVRDGGQVPQVGNDRIVASPTQSGSAG